jgi:16S rRNA G966 N2-methylase RsmD
MDPPFPMEGKLRILELAEKTKILKSGGTLTIHYPGEEDFPEAMGNLRRYDLRQYGRSELIFYTRD